MRSAGRESGEELRARGLAYSKKLQLVVLGLLRALRDRLHTLVRCLGYNCNCDLHAIRDCRTGGVSLVELGLDYLLPFQGEWWDRIPADRWHGDDAGI